MRRNRQQARQFRSRGFSLVELLVVIAIIAILVSLLAPALAHGKYMAQAAVCRNNLRQMSLSLQFYADAHDGEYPAFAVRARPGTTIAGYRVLYWNWQKLLDDKWRGDAQRNTMFSCPMSHEYELRRRDDLPDSPVPARPIPNRGERFVQYVYNAYGTGRYDRSGFGLGGHTDLASIADRHSLIVAERATKESSVRNPAEMIAFGDFMMRSLKREHDGEPNYDLFHWSSRRWETCSYATPHRQQKAFKKHRGKMNRSFVDGHVETENFKRPFVPSIDYFRRWNIDHEPHATDWGVW